VLATLGRWLASEAGCLAALPMAAIVSEAGIVPAERAWGFLAPKAVGCAQNGGFNGR